MFTYTAARQLRVVLAAAAIAAAGASAGASDIWTQARRDVNVVAYKYGYKVDGGGSEIRVQQDDLVRITFSTEDIPHSFTMEDDTYRFMRRTEPGKPVTFDFRADKPGKFVFQCTLRADDRCKEMQGTLIVEPRKTPR